jgi:hypothetical protein
LRIEPPFFPSPESSPGDAIFFQRRPATGSHLHSATPSCRTITEPARFRLASGVADRCGAGAVGGKTAGDEPADQSAAPWKHGLADAKPERERGGARRQWPGGMRRFPGEGFGRAVGLRLILGEELSCIDRRRLFPELVDRNAGGAAFIISSNE